jgi:hypothetical protein
VVDLTPLSPTDKNKKFTKLKYEFNDITGSPPKSETYDGLEEKIIFHSNSIFWKDIRENFIEPSNISTAVLKAGKALCYAL